MCFYRSWGECRLARPLALFLSLSLNFGLATGRRHAGNSTKIKERSFLRFFVSLSRALHGVLASLVYSLRRDLFRDVAVAQLRGSSRIYSRAPRTEPVWWPTLPVPSRRRAQLRDPPLNFCPSKVGGVIELPAP